eukprot:9494082-Pyramimonas_sp.AAC.1
MSGGERGARDGAEPERPGRLSRTASPAIGRTPQWACPPGRPEPRSSCARPGGPPGGTRSTPAPMLRR